MTFEVGELVGGSYEVMEKLGQGGMATVYKAYHTNLDRFVALKVLHPALKEDDTFIARFEREAKLVGKLKHANIIGVYDYDKNADNPYLVMDFIEGDTLKARLKEGPLSIAMVNHIVESVGSALEYAHKQGILHRDIKPSNIMIDNEGKIFLADFGLARMSQAGESTLSKDMLLGTPQYISPEQARGDKNLDAGTDIYSLGVVVYELVVGRVPYMADTPYAIVHDHIYSPLPLPTLVNPQVPDEIESFLLKALAKKREDRFETARIMTMEFQHAVDLAGEEAVEAATMALPRSVEEVKELQAVTQEAPQIGSKSTVVGTTSDSLPVRRTTVRRITNNHKRRSTFWPMLGFVLLLVSLIGGGIYMSQVVSEEFQRGLNEYKSYQEENTPESMLNTIIF